MGRLRVLSTSLGLGGNPYVGSLAAHLTALGAEVEAFDLHRAWRASADVAMVHWPEYALKDPKMRKALAGSIRTLAKAAVARARGIPVVWTVHNLSAHDGKHPFLERIFWRAWTALVSAHISLSHLGRELAVERFARFGKLPGTVVPHPHYLAEAAAAPSKEDARRLIGIEAPGIVYGLAGRIAPYKGVEDLARAFLSLEDPSARLVIAGQIDSSDLYDRLRAMAETDSRILLRSEPLPPDRFVTFIAAMDVVVLPYREILNSGTALFALSVGRPVVVPEVGALPELVESEGPEWVLTFPGGELDAQTLEGAGTWAIRATGRPRLLGRGWQDAARQTFDFIESLRKNRTLQDDAG